MHGHMNVKVITEFGIHSK